LTKSLIIYLSKFILPKIIPEITPIVIPLRMYKIVIFRPKNPSIRITKYSFTKGEVIRKEKHTPKGIPASKKLKKIGIEEQEQKGVIVPNKEAKILPKARFLIIQCLILSGGRYVLKKPTIATIIKSRRIIFIES